MLEIDRAGDDICDLCAMIYTLSGDEPDATGEYIETVVIAGELRSEIV